MEGTLVIPPERGTLIGRAVWKPRYVVVGPAQREATCLDKSPSSSSKCSRPPPRVGIDGTYLSIYKAKEDHDPIQQHVLSSITDCMVQMIAHRKQGPILPTLVINISPDPATDKLRKRRSSRTAGLTSTKDTMPTTLMFRPGGEDPYSLHDWSRCIRALISPNMLGRTPLSPITPVSPNFANPFAPRQWEPTESFPRPGSGNANTRVPLQHASSTHTHSSGDRSRQGEATSLRSKRSDISSNPSHIGYQNYTAVHYPMDLPSPATTLGDYQGEFIEGWTSAQGRSSTLSSPVRESMRTRDSVGSHIPAPLAMVDSSSPPGPRETILDRAFQMHFIPGSDRDVPGEEKLTSLARFDALMRQVDAKRRERELDEGIPQAADFGQGPKSGWDLDEDSDELAEADGQSSDGDNYAPEYEDDQLSETESDPADHFRMPPKAQQALSFIASRRDQGQDLFPTRPEYSRSPLSYDHETLMALSASGGFTPLRPQTGHSKERPGIAPRTLSQPHLSVQLSPRTTTGSSGYDMLTPAKGSDQVGSGTSLQRSATDKRLSTSSVKRYSITDFTKRLSNTGSLLLVQTNSSSTSSGGATEMDGQQHYGGPSSPNRGSSTPVPTPSTRPSTTDSEHDNWEKRCGFRGGVGTEGGFL